MNSFIVTGQIIHCVKPYELEVNQNGFLIIGSNGKILAIGAIGELAQAQEKLNLHDATVIQLSKTQLLLPGFIDTHIHAPQYPNVGLGYDKPLLEWLDHYTYKLERQYKDPELCKRIFDAVVRKTLDHGTTSACYFGSLFYDSTLILAQAICKYGQRALVGKVNMIKLAPDDYIESPEASISNTIKFLDEIDNLKNPLIRPVITPRFALSVDMVHMKKLAQIAKERNLHIQTHISENQAEVSFVKESFNEDYAKVYHLGDLLTPKTILAHGVYLSDEELQLLNETKTSISHCPESNINLCSGNCDVRKLQQFGIKVGLGTDVAGGASPSIISAMKSAISTSINISFTRPDYKPLNYEDAFYLATLGGAKALSLDSEIGNFEVGKSFDGLIVDLDVKGCTDYLSNNCSPRELLQKLIFVGDDRNVVQVFVNGKKVK